MLPAEDRPIQVHTYDDLKALVTNKVAERIDLEYKRSWNLTTDDDKTEICSDVSSFANTRGGIIIYGMGSDRHGLPKSPSGVLTTEIDKNIDQIKGLVGTGITPRIPNVTFDTISVSDDRECVLIRIPLSPIRPHMVSRQEDFRFYLRELNGKNKMDYFGVRNAFLLNSQQELLQSLYAELRLNEQLPSAVSYYPVPLKSSAIDACLGRIIELPTEWRSDVIAIARSIHEFNALAAGSPVPSDIGERQNQLSARSRELKPLLVDLAEKIERLFERNLAGGSTSS